MLLIEIRKQQVQQVQLCNLVLIVNDKILVTFNVFFVISVLQHSNAPDNQKQE